MNKLQDHSIKLSDLQDLLNNKHNYIKKTERGHEGVHSGEGDQGEYNETFKYYQHPALPEGIFMRETYHTDSYGDGDHLVAINFVEGKAKTITVFEPI